MLTTPRSLGNLHEPLTPKFVRQLDYLYKTLQISGTVALTVHSPVPYCTALYFLHVCEGPVSHDRVVLYAQHYHPLREVFVPLFKPGLVDPIVRLLQSNFKRLACDGRYYQQGGVGETISRSSTGKYPDLREDIKNAVYIC